MTISYYAKAMLSMLIIGQCCLSANAQIQTANLDKLSNIKGKTVYVVMKDPNAEDAKPYKDVFEKYWTISKVEFVKRSDLKEYQKADKAILVMSGKENSYQSQTRYSDGHSESGMTVSNTHINLNLLYFDQVGSSDKRKGNIAFNIAQIEIYTDFATIMSPSDMSDYDYSGEGHFRNWGPGFLKNYIQNLMVLFNSGKEKSKYKESLNEKELAQVKNKTLYIPDYVFIKFNKFNGNESEEFKEKDIFKDYPYTYKVLTTEELNKMILDEEAAPFYYLTYIKSSTDKYISVVNSKTGEFVYSQYSAASYNMKAGDVKDLAKKL